MHVRNAFFDWRPHFVYCHNWLAVERSWSALARPFLSLITWQNHEVICAFSTIFEAICRLFNILPGSNKSCVLLPRTWQCVIGACHYLIVWYCWYLLIIDCSAPPHPPMEWQTSLAIAFAAHKAPSLHLYSFVKRCRDGWGFVYLPSLLSFLVCVLFGTPFLHLLSFLMIFLSCR